MPRLEFGRRPLEDDYSALALLNLAGSFETEDVKWEQAKKTYGHEYVFDNIRRITLRLKHLIDDKQTNNRVKEIAAAAGEGQYTTYVSLLVERAYPELLPSKVDDIEGERIKSVMASIKEEIFGIREGGNYTELFSGLMKGKFKFNDPVGQIEEPEQLEFNLI